MLITRLKHNLAMLIIITPRGVPIETPRGEHNTHVEKQKRSIACQINS